MNIFNCFKYIGSLSILLLVGCINSNDLNEDYENEDRYEKIIIPSLNLVECADSTMKMNRNNIAIRDYYDVNLAISGKLKKTSTLNCEVYYGKDVENFHIKIISDFNLYWWNVNYLHVYDSLVNVERIAEGSYFDFVNGSEQYLLFKDLQSKKKMIIDNDSRNYFDLETKNFVIRNISAWLGYLIIYIEK